MSCDHVFEQGSLYIQQEVQIPTARITYVHTHTHTYILLLFQFTFVKNVLFT
jgi:hypothetical protein